MRVIHISDIHVPPRLPGEGALLNGGWRRALAQVELQLLQRARRYRSAAEVLGQIAEEIRSHRADHVVLSGDLTGLALESEFEAAREALGHLAESPERLTIVPGNHDRYTPGSMIQRRFERHFGDLLVSDLPEYAVQGHFPLVRFVGEELAVVGLDSALVPAFPGMAYGRVSKAQLEALRALLADPRVAGRTVLVTLHHAPYDRHGRPERWTHGLRDADELLRILADGKVAGLLHGHVHHRFRLTCPKTGVEIFNAGSSTERGNEGYWVMDVGAGKVLQAEQVSLGGALTELPALPLPGVA